MMNNFSITRMFNIFQKTVTAIILAAMIGILSGTIFARMAEASHTVDGNGFTNVTATPSSGTLTAGQQLQVDLTISGLDTTDTNPITSPTCLVNGVEVSSTYTNLTSGSDGHFRFIYTVGASDTDRTAGQIPINCTLVQSHTVTVTAFDDGNTVVINASGTLGADTTAPTVTSTTPASNATNVPLNSTISATFSEAMNSSTLSIDSFIVTSSAGGGSIAGSVSYSGNTATFTPGFSLTADTVYTAQITTGAEDLSGNALASTTTWNFTTTTNASSNSGPGNNALLNGSTAIDFPTAAIPSSGTLTTGQTLTVRFTDSSGTTNATSTSCLVNGVDTSSNFHNVEAGIYETTYTVGASDTNRAAGNVTIDCTIFGDPNTIEVTRFNDSNTVAIDTSGGENAPTLSGVSLSPASGTVQAGDTITATLTAAGGQTDLAVTGLCRINAVDVSGSFVNNNDGTYTLSYTVGSNDGERPAGHIPVGCTLGNSGGNVTASAWNDGNTLSIDTNDDGIIDNGTNNLGFTITASPSSGTLGVGSQLVISMQDPLPSGDVTIVPTGTVGPGSVTVSNGCKVNDVDVSGSYAYFGNGLYKVTYTVGSGDANQTAGNIPFDCSLSNHTGTVRLVAFTDNNTVAVDLSTDTTAPTVTSTNPANNATNVATDSNIEVTFSELMDSSTVNNSSFTVTSSGGAVAGSISSSGSTAVWVFNPTNNLAAGTTYTATVTTGAKDAASNPISGNHSWTFTTTGSGNTNPTLQSIAITIPATKLNYTVGESLDISGLVVTGTYSDGSTQTQSITTSNITGFNSSTTANNQVLTITVNGRTTTYSVNILAGTSVTLNNSSPQVTVANSTDPLVITVASGTTSPTINVSSLVSSGTGILPAITISTSNNVVVTIPASTTVTGDLAWNEIISAPTSTTITLPSVAGQARTLSMAIELGSTGKLSFNKGVRILFPGQAGKKVGYVRSGIEFTEITATCSADTQAAGNALATDADCKIDVGADLVVWTKHFTTFATYTQTAAGGNSGMGGGNSGGGGGGGGFSAVNLGFLNPVAQRAILGCDVRTNGFSTVTGEPCSTNIPNALTTPVNIVARSGSNGNGQVLGASTFKFTMKLKMGMSGEDVIELQNKLTELGYYTGKIDGKFGKKTRTALMKFQKAKGLKADGIMGTATMAALNM